MSSFKDAIPGPLVEELAQKIRQLPEVSAPEWSRWVKTGPQAERMPDNPDWWYVRCASILRRVAKQGPIGVGKLRKWYGRKKNRGSRPERHVDAGGAIIRNALQQLEAAGLVKKKGEKEGRVMTPKGISLLDATSAKMVPRREKKVVKKKPAKKAPKKAPKKAEKVGKAEKEEAPKKADKEEVPKKPAGEKKSPPEPKEETPAADATPPVEKTPAPEEPTAKEKPAIGAAGEKKE